MNSTEEYLQGSGMLLQIHELIRPSFPTGIIFALMGIILLIISSAMISAAEVAFFSLSAKDISQLKNSPNKNERLIIAMVEKPRELLATILIANNFVNVSIIIIFYYITLSIFDFSHYPVIGFILQVIVVTGFLVLFGEVLPKVYSAQNNLKVSRAMVYPVLFLEKLFYPFSYLLISSTGFIEKRLNKKYNHRTSLEEINHAIEMTADEKTSRQEINILKGIVKFGNTPSKEVMKARTDVVAVESTKNFMDLMKVVRESGYSRIPIYKGTLDNVIGILYSKDLIVHSEREKDFHWQQLMRPTFFIPETKKIDSLLKDFQSRKTHIAVVVDEYGGTTGIITLEDIMEEVIGDIKDEFDELHEIKFHKDANDNFTFEGKTSLNDVCKMMNLKTDVFDDVKGDADSLAGLVLQISGKMPEMNEEVHFKKFLFTVLSVDKRKIDKVSVKILQS